MKTMHDLLASDALRSSCIGVGKVNHVGRETLPEVGRRTDTGTLAPEPAQPQASKHTTSRSHLQVGELTKDLGAGDGNVAPIAPSLQGDLRAFAWMGRGMR